MKAYEMLTQQVIPESSPIIVRVDGKAFHTWTRFLEKPFDLLFAEWMRQTCLEVSDELDNFVMGYHQSDEATFVLYPTNVASTHYFGGKVQKIASVTASLITGYFNANVQASDPSIKTAFFDARAFAVPSLSEVANNLLWRHKDAYRNAIEAQFGFTFGHKASQGISMGDKLLQLGDFDPDDFAGQYFDRSGILSYPPKRSHEEIFDFLMHRTVEEFRE